MKTKTLIALVLILFLVNLIGLTSYIYYRLIQPAHHAAAMVLLPDPPERRLYLDPEQRRKLGRLLQQFQLEVNDLRQRYDSLETAVLLLPGKSPQQPLDSMVTEMGNLRREMARSLINKLLQNRYFLSEDQQQYVYRVMLRSVYDLPPDMIQRRR